MTAGDCLRHEADMCECQGYLEDSLLCPIGHFTLVQVPQCLSH